MPRLLMGWGLVCLAVQAPGVAGAQSTERAPAAVGQVADGHAAAEQATGEQATGGVVRGGIQDVLERVADADKPARSRAHVERMREILTKVLAHLEEAREERDVVKLNCVNEKLTAIKALLKISEQSDVAMQEALARRHAEASEHEYEKIAVAAAKCEQLFGESEACVGELAVYAGETEIAVEVEGEPPADISQDLPEVEIVTRPPAASPYQ